MSGLQQIQEQQGLSIYDQDIWDIRELGLKPMDSRRTYLLNFTRISQPWLRMAAKKCAKYTIATRSVSTFRVRLSAIQKFSIFLTENHLSINASEIKRPINIEYLLYLSGSNLKPTTRINWIIQLKAFLELCAINDWAEITKDPLIFRNDTPQKQKRNPRFIPQEVMEQLNKYLGSLPENIMRMVLVIQECGMRISELCLLDFDCLIQDAHGDYFLRYYQYKMRKEHTIPVSREIVAVIREQQQLVRDKLGQDYPYLFCDCNSLGEVKPQAIEWNKFGEFLNKLASEKNICSSSGDLWRFQSHQFRHTVGTRMINNGVPQHIVQRYFGHEPADMTSVYAYVHDQTLKEEFVKFKDKMVDVTGQIISYESVVTEMTQDSDPDSIDAQWLKKHIRSQALPNGLCALPMNQTECPYGANKCLTGSDGKGCPHFKTDIRYLDKHKDHLRRTNENIEWAQETPESKRSKEILKLNLPIQQNIERIISSLKTNHDT